jgi:hypothetical protein
MTVDGIIATQRMQVHLDVLAAYVHPLEDGAASAVPTTRR